MRTSMNLHDVKSIKIDKAYKLDEWETRIRHLTITYENGAYIELNLFAEDEKFLKI